MHESAITEGTYKMKFPKLIIICIMISALVCGSLCSAYAAVLAYNPDDYIARITVSNNVKCVTYDFSELTPLVYVQQECTGADDSIMETNTYVGDTLSIRPYGTCFSLDASFYPFGSYAEHDAAAPADGGLLDVSELCAGVPVTFSSSYTLLVTADSQLPMVNLDDLIVTCDFGIFKYDKNGDYLGVSYLGEVNEVFTDDKGSSSFEYTADNQWYFENDVAYILPFCSFSADSDQLNLWTFQLTEGDFNLTVGVDMEVAEAETMTAILDSCHSIETLLGYLNGFVLFFVVVLLCYFTYKFFKIFF